MRKLLDGWASHESWDRRETKVRTCIAELALALGAAVWLTAPADAQVSTQAKVKIMAPTNGGTGHGPAKVTLHATGVEIGPATHQRPGTPHRHLLLQHTTRPPI